MKDTNIKIQEFLSLGYVYLLVLGIFKDVIYYWLNGINIFSYSSVMDVLLSPLAFIAETPIFTLAIVLLVLIFLFSKKRKEKADEFQSLSTEEKKIKSYNEWKNFCFILALGLTGFFFGTGIGGGASEARKIKNKTIKFEHQIDFNDGDSKRIHLIGQNSNFVFYKEQYEEAVSISPISGNIKKIRILK